MKYKYYFQQTLFHIKGLLLNILTIILSGIIKRDHSVWVFGAWMGTRFADNSRYLFQFLDKNKIKYQINKVIWVTRNKQLKKELSAMGYQAELTSSIKGIYYHIKAGVHVVCNMPYSNGIYLGDINGNLSMGAKKIQLWHGFPIKANVNTNNSANNSKLKQTWLFQLSLPGEWEKKQYLISTSHECSARYKQWFNNNELRIIECGYPRNCNCIKTTNEEQAIFKKITKHKTTILYLPTFRCYEINFEHPLTSHELQEMIVKNNYLWIEKKHIASTENDSLSQCCLPAENYLRLNDLFDINVILRDISLLISDYSSVSVDAVYFNIPVLFYVPDYDRYCEHDRGFTNGFDSLTPGPKVFEANKLGKEIQALLKSNKEMYNARYEDYKKVFFDSKIFSYECIAEQIINATQ